MSDIDGIDATGLDEALDLVLVWRSTLIDDQCHWSPCAAWTPAAYSTALTLAASMLAEQPGGGDLDITGDIEAGELTLTDAAGDTRWWAKWLLCDREEFTAAVERTNRA